MNMKKSLEEILYSYFEKAVEQLNRDLEIERNVSITINNRRVEIDLLIKKDEEILAVVEFKELIQQHSVSKFKDSIKYISNCLHSSLSILCSSKELYYSSYNTDIWSQKNITTDILIKELLELFKTYFSDTEKTISWEEVKKEWITILRNLEIKNIKDFKNRDELIDFLTKVTPLIVEEKNCFSLSKKDEDNFFKSLIGKYNGRKLCRFTTMSSLFRTLNEAQQSMCSIVCMNDKTEPDFVSSNYSSIEPYLNTTNPNSFYILSCCDINRKNDFTMLRLYADDAKGVCIEYDIELKDLGEPFYLGRIQYADINGKHPKLDYLESLILKKIKGKSFKLNRTPIWHHFFKPYEFKDEKEIRLLFFNDYQKETGLFNKEVKWILNEQFGIVSPLVEFSISEQMCDFPLIINKINLGPKTRECKTNEEQLECLIRNKKIVQWKQITIEKSKVKCYR